MASETSGRSAAGSSSQVSYSDAELEKLLNREASAFQRELEVERILKAFKLKYVVLRNLVKYFILQLCLLSPYDILDVDEKIPAEGVKKKYKQLSLCVSLMFNHSACTYRYLVIHPDKTSHPRAPEAFDLLKKVFLKSFITLLSGDNLFQAESDLSDKDKREILDALIRQARTALLKDLQLPAYTEDDDARLTSLQPSFKTQLRAKSKELLIDEEVARRKLVCWPLMHISSLNYFPFIIELLR